MTDDVRKLLGGYATGTLTEAEREKLFQAALNDQTLFEALADEQALADLLEDTQARAALLQAAETPEFSILGVIGEWFSRPRSKVLVALGSVAIVGITVQTYRERALPPLASRPKISVSVPQPAEAPQQKQPEPQLLSRNDVPKPRKDVIVKPPPIVTGEAAAGSYLPPPQPAAAPAPKMEQLATTPPPPAAEMADSESAIRTLSVAGIDLRYTFLRRTTTGADIAVPPTYAFAPTDRVRLRVEATQDGTFEIRRNGGPMYTGAASAGTPIVVPAELAFDDVAVHTIQIRFEPLSPVTMSRSEFRTSEKAPAAARAITAQSPAAINTQIVLRRKND
jgi:hypothetical protein